MVDFNYAETQRTNSGFIPDDSIVTLQMTINPPKFGKEGDSHPLFCRSAKGNEYIDVEFEVVGGNFAGHQFRQFFTLVGSESAAKISMRTLRAIIESARGISPSDISPVATASRQISDWADFNGMLFLSKITCKTEQRPNDSNWYIKNEIKRVITIDDSEYKLGEQISEKPLPVLPTETATPASSLSQTAQTAPTTPAWARR